MLLNKITKVLLLSIVMLSSLVARPGGGHTVGEINPNKTSIVAAPRDVTADGMAISTISVYLEDYNDTAITNATIELVARNENDAIVGNMVNENNGTYTFAIKSNVVEIVEFKANASARDVNDALHTDTTDYVSINFIPRALPYGVTVEGGAHYIASVFDVDYKPYTPQYSPARTESNVAADYQNDVLVNIQGNISATGTIVEIPYTAVSNSYLPRYVAAAVIPADSTEDGVSRRIYLSYDAAMLTRGHGLIRAKVYTNGAIINVKKLDINVGIGDGSDKRIVNHTTGYLASVYGVLLGNFNIALNAQGDYGEFHVRSLPGVPDRNFGVDHKFLYLPKVVNGKTWLNNNLGANYTNLESSAFDIAKQALYPKDEDAYGSFFAFNASNVCPVGYRLPTRSELNAEKNLWSNSTKFGAINSELRLSMAGHWERQVHQKAPRRKSYCSDNEKFRYPPKRYRKKGCDKNRKIVAYYLGTNRSTLAFNVFGSGVENAYGNVEYSVRCIKNNN